MLHSELAYDVIVIGAGLSGLAAASSLTTNNFKVCVLEARNRVGGRTETLPHDLVDLGAQWIGPAHSEILRLVQKHKLTLEEQYYPVSQSGRLTECVGYRQAALEPDAFHAVNLYMELISQLCSEINLDSPWSHRAAAEWDVLSVYSHVYANVKESSARAELLLFVQTVLACDPANTSFLFFLFYVKSGGGIAALGDGPEGAQKWKLKGGMQQLSNLLARDAEVRCSSVVRRVETAPVCTLTARESNTCSHANALCLLLRRI
jgi:monoamine oxidase